MILLEASLYYIKDHIERLYFEKMSEPCNDILELEMKASCFQFNEDSFTYKDLVVKWDDFFLKNINCNKKVSADFVEKMLVEIIESDIEFVKKEGELL